MKKDKAKTTEELSFEDALSNLEALVEKLEEGETPLEESIQAYAQGMSLVQHCMGKLEKAEETLKRLSPQEDSFELIDAPLGDDDPDHA